MERYVRYDGEQATVLWLDMERGWTLEVWHSGVRRHGPRVIAQEIALNLIKRRGGTDEEDCGFRLDRRTRTRV